MSMEERKVGLPTQQNTFDTLKKILRDAHRRGGISDDPFQGVVPPEHIPNRVTIPTLEEIHAFKGVGYKALVVIIDLMSGCWHRNGEVFAADLEGMVADDVYRITEQIEGTTRQRAPLKHRKPGEFRGVPLPASQAIVLSMVQRCRPSRCEVSTPLRAIRCRIPRRESHCRSWR